MRRREEVREEEVVEGVDGDGGWVRRRSVEEEREG